MVDFQGNTEDISLLKLGEAIYNIDNYLGTSIDFFHNRKYNNVILCVGQDPYKPRPKKQLKHCFPNYKRNCPALRSVWSHDRNTFVWVLSPCELIKLEFLIFSSLFTRS